MLPSVNVQQLSQQIQLDQNVHLQDPTDNTFTINISKHLPPQQKARLLKEQTIGGSLTGYCSTIRHQPRGYTR
jgi:hypothetical protein